MKTFQQLLSEKIQSDSFDKYFMEHVLDAFNESTSELQNVNQTLLDEVNRLNAHIDELEKYYDSLRD